VDLKVSSGAEEVHRGIEEKPRQTKVYKYTVFSGNYPQYIRDALTLRECDTVKWEEVEPTLDAINHCDLIWKPFNFAKQVRD